MTRLSTIVLAAVMAVAIALPAAAQTSTKTKTTAPVKAKVATSVKSSAQANKVTGTVTRDKVSNGMITIGVPKQGRITVDTTGAKIRGKNGKFLSINSIKPGANITAMGKMSGKSFKASDVIVNWIPGAPKTAKTTTAKTTKPATAVKVAGVKK